MADLARGPDPRGLLYAVGGFCARRHWLVLAAWVVIVVLATLGNRAFGGTYEDDFTLPGSESQEGAQLLEDHGAGAGRASQIVFEVSSGSITDHSSSIEAAITQLGTADDVVSVSDPLTAGSVSSDGTTAFATVRYESRPGEEQVEQADAAMKPVRADKVVVDYGGELGQAARPDPNDAVSEITGLLVAVIVLLLGFGSVYAALLPLVSASLGVAAGIGVLGMVAAITTFASVSPTLGLMMGLGVGIDYALFIVTRHRQSLMDGMTPEEAASQSLSASGRAVLIAAVTVVLALLGLYASGISFIGKLGVAAAITVSVAAAAAITLVPALLGIAGRGIDRRHVHTPVAESAADGKETSWHRYAHTVERHPWRYLTAGVGLLLILGIPTLSMDIGHVDAGADPTDTTSRQAYDTLSEKFGPGYNGPFTVVVEVGTASPDTLAPTLSDAIAATPNVDSVSPPQTSSDGALLTTTVIPKTGPQDDATDELLSTLRETTLPKALDGTDATSYVTGPTAGQLDFKDTVAGRVPLIIGVVLLGAFVLLLLAFRSPLLAVKAVVLNLISIGAAYGVVVAVFQWGWGSSLLGIEESVPVESYVPMMMFAIVFGLSMDYEVFLLSRVREEWFARFDNTLSVAEGLAATARVISCAALIMTSVFLAFVLSDSVVIQMLALGLAASVLVDATVVRLLVVPAAMFLMGSLNWWIPKWLDRALPHLEPEPASNRMADS